MAENKPTTAPATLPDPKRDTPTTTTQVLADRKSRLPRERLT